MPDINEEDFFSEDNKAESNWFKFENVGDSILGTYLSKTVQPGSNGYADQIVYEIKRQSDGKVFNVGLSVGKRYVHQRMRNYEFGDIIGFKFTKEVPSSRAGYAPAKSIEVFPKKAEKDPNYLSQDDLEREFEESL